VLLEWPDRAAGFLPADRLDIAFTLAPQLGADVRNARVTGYGAFAERAERIAIIRRFLDEAGLGDAHRERMEADASTRSYERLTQGERRVILMNAPRRPDGPPIRHGKSYSAIAHLAEDVAPFVALARALRQLNFSAPIVYEADLEHGLLVLEDLGDRRIVEGDPPAPIEPCYESAIDVLVALHGHRLPDTLPVAPQREYHIPRYDMDAFLIEAELFLDWYLPRIGITVAEPARAGFIAPWRAALQPAIEKPQTWVLRDFHSPNLLWLPERFDVARIGILDFQDALMGPAAYDVASLLQDARVDMPEALELALLGQYAYARRVADPSFDAAAFVRCYATLAAQRATKILGIFARLDRRDGKPQYLRHIPRIWGYLQRSLAHPSLTPLKTWYTLHVPAVPKV
jgi:aminoglycoside/choline kinase family phosphotransferase